MSFEGAPKSVQEALTVLDDWSRYGVCPNIRKADVACAWRCYECKQVRDATVGSVSTGDYGKSRVFGPGVPGGVRCALSSSDQSSRGGAPGRT